MEESHDHRSNPDYEEVEGRSLEINSKHTYRNGTIKVGPSSTGKDIEDIKKMLEKQEQRRLNKLYVKIIGGIIAVLVISGISICYRAMCKKKISSVPVATEETVPYLPPGSYHAQPNSYPPQQTPYAPQQAPYLAEQASYPQEPAPYPSQPAPYPSQPAPYPPQPAPYPSQQVPYPQLNSYPMQGSYPYLQEQTSHPPPADGSYVPLTKT